MFNKIVFSLILAYVFLIFRSGEVFCDTQINKILDKEEITSLAKDYKNASVLYGASEKFVYKIEDAGKKWSIIFGVKEMNKKINKIYTSPYSDNTIYAAAQGGLYQSQDRGESWIKIFKGNSDLESNCLSAARSSRVIYLGTEEGLFMSYDEGKKWIKSSSQFPDSIISSIVINPQDDKIAYLACEKGVFISEDDGKNWKRIFVSYGSEIPSEDYDDYDAEVSYWLIDIRCMAISLVMPPRLYIVAAKGIFFTQDKGIKWQEVKTIGLPSLNIRSMIISNNNELFTATDKGVFKLEQDQWVRISGRIASQDFNDLGIGDSFIWTAGKEGVFKIGLKDKDKDYSENNNFANGSKDIKFNAGNLFKDEPSIGEVQKAAIEYADANMNKIKSWRNQARMKALMPSLSLDYDKTVTTALGASYDRIQVGPQDWGMSLQWDLADLIWNDDQTSIDTRSRLTVQLRQDILDQVTRLYFQRQKLKMEILLSPPQSQQERLYKGLEIQEITAGIDGLTNGYFSKHLKSQD